MEREGEALTVHGLSLRVIMSLVLGDKVLEVGFGVLRASDFILGVDEITEIESAYCRENEGTVCVGEGMSDVLTPAP